MNALNTIEKVLLGASPEQLEVIINAKRTIRDIERGIRFPHVVRGGLDGNHDGKDGHRGTMSPKVKARIRKTMLHIWAERRKAKKVKTTAKKTAKKPEAVAKET